MFMVMMMMMMMMMMMISNFRSHPVTLLPIGSG
jgi:hypothetical protein